LARKHNRKYVGSTSSTTSALSQIYFTISNWRETDIAPLSLAFQDEVNIKRTLFMMMTNSWI
jgi:hypothetical protein